MSDAQIQLDPSGIQYYFQTDLSPFREIRTILPGLSPEQVQGLAVEVETRVIPSDNEEWVHREPTGRRWFTLTFLDKKITFIQDQEGVRVGELPESTTIVIG